jgi:hypothetical protein
VGSELPEPTWVAWEPEVRVRACRRRRRRSICCHFAPAAIPASSLAYVFLLCPPACSAQWSRWATRTRWSCAPRGCLSTALPRSPSPTPRPASGRAGSSLCLRPPACTWRLPTPWRVLCRCAVVAASTCIAHAGHVHRTC